MCLSTNTSTLTVRPHVVAEPVVIIVKAELAEKLDLTNTTTSKRTHPKKDSTETIEKKKRVHPARSKKQNRKAKTKQQQDDASVSSECSVSSTSSTSPKMKKMKRPRVSPGKNKKQTKWIKQPSPYSQHVCLTEQESRFVAMDCEMVGVGEQGRESALARVSIVNFYGHVLLNTYVKVEDVIDFRTHVSGITKKHISSKRAMEVGTCRDIVKSLLKGKILVGHGLKNDLKVLGMHHPWYDIRDTTKFVPYMKDVQDGCLTPRKLKELSSFVLGKEIQKEGIAHCPIVDSRTAMELYKHASGEWEQVMEYKINRTKEILSFGDSP